MTLVSPVDSRERRRQWIQLPYHIYRDDAAWVPPLESEATRIMNARANPLFRHAEVAHFIAERTPGEAAGRLAVCIDRDYVAHTASRTAFFGFFEAFSDQRVASALFDHAASWARERGMNRLVGPFNYTSNQEQGLLVGGFDTRPALFQPHNPEYYANLLEGWGMVSDYRMSTYSLDEAWYAAAAERAARAAQRTLRRYKLTLRKLDTGRFKHELEAMRRLLNRSFAENRNFLPFNVADFAFQAAALRHFVDPEQVLILERDGEVVAGALVLPNINEVLAKLNGRLGLLGLLRATRLLRGVDSLVIAMIGVVPELKGAGVGVAIVHGILNAARGSRYRKLYSSFIDDDNNLARSLAERLFMRREKEYTIYARAL